MIVADRLHCCPIWHQLCSNDQQSFVWKMVISEYRDLLISRIMFDMYFRKIIIREAGKTVFSIYTETTRR